MTVIKNRSGISWCILYSKNLTQAEKMVFFALKDRAYQVDKTCMKGFYCYLDWIEKNLSLSDKTVQKAIRGLREKQLISSKRVKMHRNVVNQWTINWDIIDDMQKKFKFAEIEYEETDILEDEIKPDVQTERPIITPTYEDIEESIEETTVSEVKTPSIPIKEEKKEDEFQKDVEVAVNELAQIALYGKGKKLFDETLTTHSNNLSIRYNKLYDDVEEQLRDMSKKKYLKFKGLKEVG